MNEKALLTGKHRHLVGILTEPDAEMLDASKPVVIFMNAGLIHRVGPYRLHVDLARRLAVLGFRVCRFDIGNVGDSSNRPEAVADTERMLMDAREVMDTLSQRWGAQKFVLMGLCAGAANAHTIALNDERVNGAIFLDGYQYPTLKFFWKRYGPKIWQLPSWLRFFKRTFTKPDATNNNDSSAENAVFVVDDLSKSHFAKDLRQLLARGAHLFYVYSGGLTRYNYRDQFMDAFRKLDPQGHISVEYFDQADHLYILLEDREKLMDSICSWMHQHFPSKPTDTPTEMAS